MIDLRPYQQKSVDQLRANFLHGIKRQVLCSPTGSGKTEIAMDIVSRVADAGNRSIFCCDRQTLVQQTSGRYYGAGIDHGILMGEQSKQVWHDTIVASAQTLESRGFDWTTGGLFEVESSTPPDLIILDECHIIRKQIVDYAIANDVPLIGLSATPFAPALGKIYQTVVNVTTTTKLLEDGWLCPLKVVGPSDSQAEIDVAGLPPKSGGEWGRDDVSERVLRVVGDIAPEWIRRTTEYFGRPVPTIAFSPSVADCEELAEEFQAAGYDFRVISYRQSAEEKQVIIERFKRGEHIGLISCAALERGFDVPAAQVMIDAYPLRRSLSTLIQRVGRVMRIAPGKEFGLIIDHSSNWISFQNHIHAFFDEGVQELSNDRLHKAKRADPEKVKHLKCRECGFVVPKRQRGDPPITECPSCGNQMRRPRGKLERVHGRLDQIDEVDGKGRMLPFEGDWWVHICAHVCRITNDDERARKMAFAKYRQIFNRWPTGEFIRTNIPPDPAVERYCHNQYLRFKTAQRKVRQKEKAAA